MYIKLEVLSKQDVYNDQETDRTVRAREFIHKMIMDE